MSVNYDVTMSLISGIRDETSFKIVFHSSSFTKGKQFSYMFQIVIHMEQRMLRERLCSPTFIFLWGGRGGGVCVVNFLSVCVLFVFYMPTVVNVTCVSRLFILDCLFGFLWRLVKLFANYLKCVSFGFLITCMSLHIFPKTYALFTQFRREIIITNEEIWSQKIE